jgi:hypothetical protein
VDARSVLRSAKLRQDLLWWAGEGMTNGAQRFARCEQIFFYCQ